MFKELWTLIKLLFNSNPKNIEKVELLGMNNFPFKGYKYMMWCGKMIYRKDMENKRKEEWKLDSFKYSLNHETIHLELAKIKGSWIKYYWKYLIEWIKGNPFTHPSHSAYYTIPFEMEAYGNEKSIGYKPTKDSILLYTIKDRKSTYIAFRRDWKNYCKLRGEY